MSGSDVPLVILTSPQGDCDRETRLDIENNDVTKTSQQPQQQIENPPPVGDEQDEETEAEAEAEPDVTTRLTDNAGGVNEGPPVRKSPQIGPTKDRPPPSYNSIFSSGHEAGSQHQNGQPARKLSRLSLPSARSTLRRLSDTWRDFSPRSSLTSIWPDSPSSATTLTGFIIRDKHADVETQTRQVLRLASVLLGCGIIILILEILTSVYTSASWVAGYSRCGISVGALVATTGILGISSATQKDPPRKCLNFFKGFSLLSLLTGLVVLCSTLASLDIRWISQSEMRASVFEVVLTAIKVVVAIIAIGSSLASIYV